MKVTQAVFGVFHHFELAHQLHRRNHLQKIYSTWPWARLKREGLPHSLVSCFPLLHTPDYLLNRTRLYSPRMSSRMASWNTLAFDRWTNRIIGPCDAFIAISGAGLLTGHKVQANGGIYLCDRGSTHQRYQENVIADEYRRWNVPQPLNKPHITMREEEIYATADAITVPSSVARRSFLQMGSHPIKSTSSRTVFASTSSPAQNIRLKTLLKFSLQARSASGKAYPISFKPSAA